MKVKQIILTPNKELNSMEVFKDSLVVCMASYDHLLNEEQILAYISELAGPNKYAVKVVWEK